MVNGYQRGFPVREVNGYQVGVPSKRGYRVPGQGVPGKSGDQVPKRGVGYPVSVLTRYWGGNRKKFLFYFDRTLVIAYIVARGHTAV